MALQTFLEQQLRELVVEDRRLAAAAPAPRRGAARQYLELEVDEWAALDQMRNAHGANWSSLILTALGNR